MTPEHANSRRRPTQAQVALARRSSGRTNSGELIEIINIRKTQGWNGATTEVAGVGGRGASEPTISAASLAMGAAWVGALVLLMGLPALADRPPLDLRLGASLQTRQEALATARTLRSAVRPAAGPGELAVVQPRHVPATGESGLKTPAQGGTGAAATGAGEPGAVVPPRAAANVGRAPGATPGSRATSTAGGSATGAGKPGRTEGKDSTRGAGAASGAPSPGAGRDRSPGGAGVGGGSVGRHLLQDAEDLSRGTGASPTAREQAPSAGGTWSGARTGAGAEDRPHAEPGAAAGTGPGASQAGGHGTGGPAGHGTGGAGSGAAGAGGAGAGAPGGGAPGGGAPTRR